MSYRIRRPIPLDPRRPLPEDRSWFAITTQPRREFEAAHWLELNGSFSLIPLVYSQPRRWHGSRKVKAMQKVALPLIPRIVIAGMDRPPQATELRMSCSFITGVLGTAGTPISIPETQVQRLRAISEALLLPQPEFKPGDRVKMPASGVWDSSTVVEIARIRGDRAYINRFLFGSERMVEVALEKLQAAA